MKSILLLPAIFLFFTFNILAQQKKSKWNIEVSGGLSAATFYNSNAPLKNFSSGFTTNQGGMDQSPTSDKSPSYYDYSNKFLHRIRYGTNYGILFSYMRNEKWSFAVGVKIENKGLEHRENHTLWNGIGFQSQSFTFNHNSIHVKFNNQYLTVPVSVRYNVFKYFYLEAGVYISALLSSDQYLKIKKESVQTYGNSVSMSGSHYNFPSTPNTTKSDFGILAGVIYKRPINDKFSWLISCQFALGFRNLDSKYHNDYSEEPWYLQTSGTPTSYNFGNYSGYSSNSRNMNAMLNASISYNL